MQPQYQSKAKSVMLKYNVPTNRRMNNAQCVPNVCS